MMLKWLTGISYERLEDTGEQLFAFTHGIGTYYRKSNVALGFQRR